MYVMTNKRECQQEVSSILRGSNDETVGSKGCVEPRDSICDADVI